MTDLGSTYVSIILAVGGLFFVVAIWVLNWSVRKGQWDQMDKTSKCIFSEDEPIGTQTDFFPNRKDVNVHISKNAVVKKHKTTNRLNF